MNLSEYVQYDATGLAQLITSRQVAAQEVQQIARQAIAAVNPALNALVGELFDEPLPFWTSFLAGNALGLATAFGIELSPDVLEATTLACVEYGQRVTALDYSNARPLLKREAASSLPNRR